MSDGVVVVGPVVLSGPGTVDADLAAVALDGIDDELALIGDRTVPVDELWREVLGAAVNGPTASMTVIHPSWWANSRIDRVRAAALAWAPDVVMSARSELISAATSVEVAPELVVVHADGQRRAFARVPGVVDAVVGCLDGVPDAAIDAPAGLAVFGAQLARALRDRGVEVTVRDDRSLVRGALARRDVTDRGPVRRLGSRALVAAVAVAATCALGAAALAVDGGSRGTPAVTWLVEGRAAVEVPAQWLVERITSGPGSARVQVVSPENHADAIHVTQSRVPGSQTLEESADALRTALADEPEGVFVDFTAAGVRAGRAAVTYRESRGDRRVDWIVLLDGGIRIAIGCQGPQGSGAPCDTAVRSAHAVGRK